MFVSGRDLPETIGHMENLIHYENYDPEQNDTGTLVYEPFNFEYFFNVCSNLNTKLEVLKIGQMSSMMVCV